MYFNLYTQLLLGLFLADLSTAIVHWFEDTYLDPKGNILIISWIARDNEIHHKDPRKMVKTPWYILIRVTFFISLITVLSIYIFDSRCFHMYKYLYITWAFMGTFSNIVHKWSHMYRSEIPYFIYFLQKCNIICDHRHHAHHHFIDSTMRYGVIFPVTNYLVDSIKIFRIFEGIIYILFRIVPNPKLIYQVYNKLQPA
jgi:hypothetical protein